MENTTVKAIRATVLENYREVVLRKTSNETNESNCCTTTPTNLASISDQLGYSASEFNEVPQGANLGIGCGNPQTIASLKLGETVLDLGSGAGFDCFLAAKSVGELGKVIGVDMTPEMIYKAQKNAKKGNYTNTEFRLGEIEDLPLPNNTIDVIISNCVINLSPEKDKVFNEAFRVLKPGGRIAISDIVATAPFPEKLKNDDYFCGCMSGASSIDEITDLLKSGGFVQIEIEAKDQSKEFIQEWSPGSGVENYIISATIKAVKP